MGYITRTDLSDLGYDLSKLTNDQLDDVCETACAMIDSYTQQSFSPEEVVEIQGVFKKNNWLVIFPNFLPVISVKSIELYESPQTTVSLDLSNMVINAGDGCIMLPSVNPFGMVARMTYTHGFASIPIDIVKAALLIAGRLIENKLASKQTGFGNLTSIREGAITLSFGDGAKTELPSAAKALLNNYVRVR